MTSKEATIYQLKNLKGKPLKQKLEYLVSYFWAPLFVTIVILWLVVSYFIHLATVKEPGLSVACLNAYIETSQVKKYISEFAFQSDIDLDKYEVCLSADMVFFNDDAMSSYDTIQVLMTKIAGQSIDVMVSDPRALSFFAYQEAFLDLNQVLSPEQRAKYEQYYLYVDMSLLEHLETNINGEIEYPDPTKPELMEKPIPVALMLPMDSRFRQICYPYEPNEVAVGVIRNSMNINNALSFLCYIMQ